MIEHSFVETLPGVGTLVVIQLSPRRWAVAEQVGLFLHNPEYRVVSRPISNRVDAHIVCSELATKEPVEYSALTNEHLLAVDFFRGRTYLRSQLLSRSEN